MIRAVIFDLDGVLVETPDLHYEALNMALESVGVAPIPRDEHLRTYNGLPTKTKLRMLGVDESVATIKQDFTFRLLRESIRPDPEVTSLVRVLMQQHVVVGCYSNAVTATTEFILQRLGIYGSLAAIVSNEEMIKPYRIVNPTPKPHPCGYWLAMLGLGISPPETLIVEDSPKGVSAATASGASVLVVDGPSDLKPERLLSALMEGEACRS